MTAATTRLVARVFAALVALTMLVNAGTVIGFATAFKSELWPVRGIATGLYFSLLGGGYVLLASLALGYGWTRWPLVALAWGLLTALVASLPRLMTRFGAPGLAFVLVAGANVALLRILHGERLKAAVSVAAESRKARYPKGFGLVLVTGLTTLLAAPAALALVAYDIQGPDGDDWLGTPRLGQRIVLYVGVLIGVLVIVLLARSRVPLFAVLGMALLVSGAHWASSLASSPGGGSMSSSPLAPFAALMSAIGLLVATRPAFRQFWSRYPPTQHPRSNEAAPPSTRTHRRKKRIP
jgi:hypothetical protein